jgi:hypothetical protein
MTVMLGRSTARAQVPVWSLASDSFTGFTQGFIDDFDPLNPLTPCRDPNLQLAMNATLPGKNKAGRSYAICSRRIIKCPLTGVGLVVFSLEGIGSPVVTIDWLATSKAYHNCPEPLPYVAQGIADLFGTLGLKITGDPNTAVTVDYRWDHMSFTNLRHEALMEDSARIFSTALCVADANMFSLAKDANLVNIPGRQWRWLKGSGSAGSRVDQVVNFNVAVRTDAGVTNPGKGPFWEDQSSATFEGWAILSLIGPPDTLPSPFPFIPPAEYEHGQLEFSLDIGSDTELSDPNWGDNDQAFDPGDAYAAYSSVPTPPGENGIRDDSYIFATDPWPIPGIVMPTGAPTCVGPPTEPCDVAEKFFDLDGHDNIDFSLAQLLDPGPLEPIRRFPSECVMAAKYLVISYDDDAAGHYVGDQWAICDVPVRSQSPASKTYGTTSGTDEILGVILLTAAPPTTVAIQYPIEDEQTLHSSLAPNPDVRETDDDDVDSLDITYDPDLAYIWLFSPDHEATYADPCTVLALDPGGVYEVTSAGVFSQVIDDVSHLGLDEDTDIDAFELVWSVDPDSVEQVFTLLFSVDEDDPLTPGADESGGLDPKMIYASYLTGHSFPFLDEPLDDDVDALTAAWRPVLPSTDCNGNGVPDHIDLAAGAARDCNGNRVPDECDIASGVSPDRNCNDIPDECEIIGDTDNDGDVDFVDYALFALHWLEKSCGACGGADLTCDGGVDFNDVRELADSWLAGL